MERFIKRDDEIVLLGAWMGTKFADNTRYLFQYLADSNNVYKCKKAIWITRDETVNEILNQMGYSSFLVNTKESKFWHLKSGIHIICNAAFSTNNYEPDIDVRYSWGAKKVQLWHGIAIKKFGAMSNEKEQNQNSRKNLKERIKNIRIIKKITTLGGWSEEYVLCTSNKASKINRDMMQCPEDRLFISSYPRDCECIRLLKTEESVISLIKEHKFSVLYLPTFRQDQNEYIHPMDNEFFVDYLLEKDILWVEKPHAISKDLMIKDTNKKNVLLLDKNFDINVLLKVVDSVISDYSSVIYDGILLRTPVIIYAPDIDIYAKGKNGLLFDIRENFSSILSENIEELQEDISRLIQEKFWSEDVENLYRKTIDVFFDNQERSYDKIWNDIVSLK